MHSILDVDNARRVWRRLALAVLGSAFAASAALPDGVWAVSSTPDVQAGDPPEHSQGMATCLTPAWSAPIVKIHLAEFSGDSTRMVDAIRDVNAQMALVGGSSVAIESTVTTTTPFHYTPYYDREPVIHVGFQSIAAPNVAANTWNVWSCEHFITIDTDFASTYDTPAAFVAPGYYDADVYAPDLGLYFRPVYQHELLHAFGVGNDADGHPNNVYSFLNYGEIPWTNAAEEAMIRPLPYDVGQLRHLYPALGSRTEVAVLNTWMVRQDTPLACAPNVDKAPGLAAVCASDPRPEEVTVQKKLCAPSAGSVSNPSKLFAGFCGDANATAVCPGSTVQVHYTVANYSTSDVSVTANFWLSRDDAWDRWDTLSPTSKTYSVGAATAQNKYAGFELASPSLSPLGLTNYHVIVRLTAVSPSGVTVRDSIPMRGTVSIGPECHAPAGGAIAAPDPLQNPKP